MKKYRKYKETVESHELIKITCDKCMAEIPLESQGYIRRFELEFVTGESYPEGGYEEGWKVEDLCDKCIGWLKGMLIENNVKLSDTNSDW